MCPTESITMQCGLQHAGKQKLTIILVYSGVVCRLPREPGACANSVYQALFPPPPHKSLGTRLHCAVHRFCFPDKEIECAMCGGGTPRT